MGIRNFCTLLTAAGLFTLAACGGGSGTRVASTPTPPPPPPLSPPPPAPPLIAQATQSQEFTGKGAAFERKTAADPVQGPLLDDSAQLRVRFDASTGSYQVALPGTQNWMQLFRDPQAGADASRMMDITGAVRLHAVQFASTGYQYSALVSWNATQLGKYGTVAVGIPTPAGGVPVTGSATYSGQIAGRSTELIPDFLAGPWPAGIGGSISLAFNFGGGTLSGSVSPTLEAWQSYSLATLNFTDTVYSSGSTVFSGKFATGLGGLNAFSGRFTGQNAQELIGNFAFPYTSPLDGKVYQAGGGFVGKGP